MSILTCLCSPLISPEGEAMPTVRLVAPLGDRGGGGMPQIMYDMILGSNNHFLTSWLSVLNKQFRIIPFILQK